MLYATPFPRRLTPILRYRVGDKALWLGDSCACGRTTPLFKLLGRGDDVLRIGFDSVDYEHFQGVAAKVKGLMATAQMEKRRLRGKDLLILRVESEARPRVRAALAARLAREFVTGRPTLEKLIAAKTVWPVRVEIVEPGAIARNARTGKLIRVRDLDPSPSPLPASGARVGAGRGWERGEGKMERI